MVLAMWHILFVTNRPMYRTRDFEDLLTWQKSVRFSAAIYKISNSFPVEERYGMQSQIRRAAVSIPSNIAEGAGRETDKEFRRFIDIAVGSAFEVQSLLAVAKELSFIENEGYKARRNDAMEIVRMCVGLKRSLKT